MGALQIPIGTYHRSESGKEGSIVLNQATRDDMFDQRKEFSPVSLRSNKQLRKARQTYPVYWIWEEERIKKVKLDCKGFSKNTQLESIIKVVVIFSSYNTHHHTHSTVTDFARFLG